MDTQGQASISSSQGDCKNEAGQGTSTLVGGRAAKGPAMPSTQTHSKRRSISSTSATSPSFEYDKKDAKKQRKLPGVVENGKRVSKTFTV